MGFFDEYQDTSAGNWVKAEGKADLMESGTPFTVRSCSLEDTERFGERYRLEVTLVDGEEALMGFGAGSVDSRDRMLDAMAKYLEDDKAAKPIVVLEKNGRSQILRAFDPA